MIGAASVFVGALILAFLVEALLEYVLGIWWKPLEDGTRKKVVLAVGLVIGIGLSIGYKLDLIGAAASSLGITLQAPPWLGQILTGAIIGRGSTYLHDFWKKITGG